MLRAIAAIVATFVAIVAIGLRVITPAGEASSHREAPLISKDPQVDGTDVYVFRSPDVSNTLTFVSNWIPFEEPSGGPNFYHFANDARYNINVDKNGDGVEDITYRWTFRTAIQNPNTFLYATGPITGPTSPSYNYRQYYTVTEIITSGGVLTENILFGNVLMPPDNIGPRSTPNYHTNIAVPSIKSLNVPGGAIKEYTGQRADPFFVDVGSIFDLGALRPFNQAHLVKLNPEPGINSTAGFNVHSNIIQVPISRIVPECTNVVTDKKCVIGVWSTAERPAVTTRSLGAEVASGAYVQVSRLGHPLVNEVVMPLALKDTFNGLPPALDKDPAIFALIAPLVTDPELAKLIPVLYPGVTVPPAPRNDLVEVFVTGIPGLTQQTAGLAAEILRINVAVAPTAGVCKGNRLGVLASDLAGYPNGRRLEDDVTDIAVRAVAGVLVPAFNKAPNNLLGDGVDKMDTECLPSFPYLSTPHDGYYRRHAERNIANLPLVVPNFRASW